ncbi:hypothetical protein QQZ08_008556 [Neonectria magnoliae]|uniref:Uncharacterized protein n=1 Tax=Neonectria magnoliae TaxID=2732573 RepID=A0ABR1HVA2_9HYPO
MPSQVSFDMPPASANHQGEDVIYSLIYRHRSSFKAEDSPQEPLSVEDQMDADVKSVIKCLRRTRDTMTEMSRQHPINTTELADLVFEARKMSRNMTFIVRRHFDAKEEGMRVQRERELSALNAQGHGLIKYYTKRVTLAMKNFAESRLAMNTNRYDKRIQLLEDAMHKVDMHRMLVVLAEGTAPY